VANPAKVYAAAMLGAAKESGAAQEIGENLRDLLSAHESNENFRALLKNVSLGRNTLDGILKEILLAIGANKLVFRLVYMLSERGRLAILPELVGEYWRLLDLDSGVLAGELKSAIELSGEELDRLTAAISKRVGQKIRFESKVDPDLLGGFVARAGGKTYDASLRAQLNRLRDELI